MTPLSLRPLIALSTALLLAVSACDTAGPAEPGPAEPGPAEPGPAEPGPQPPLRSRLLVDTFTKPCVLRVGAGHGFRPTAAYGTAGLFVAATGAGGVDCDGTRSPIWNVSPAGEIDLVASHPFDYPAKLIGARDGFYALESTTEGLRIAWMSTDGTVLDSSVVVSEIRSLPDAYGGSVDVIHDSAAPKGIRAFWLNYNYRDQRDNVIHAVTPDGQTLWTMSGTGPLGDVHPVAVDGEAVYAVDIGYSGQGQNGRLVRVGAGGTIAWEAEATAEHSWEFISVDTVVPTPEGGAWAVGRVFGSDFGQLLLVEVDASGVVTQRITLLENVARVLHARLSGDGLAVVLASGLHYSREGPLRSLLLGGEGEVLATQDGPTVPLNYLDRLADLGDEHWMSFARVSDVTCLNAAGGCFGVTGFSLYVYEFTR